VADFILKGGEQARTIAFVAAGERWPDGSLRPAIEDLWGAGAIIAALDAGGWRSRSPEAELAMLGYDAVRDRVPEALRTCASGRELIAMGYPGDVDIAAELKRSSAVPILEGYEFVAG
jgi:2-phosphosulfolactate phosphatase